MNIRHFRAKKRAEFRDIPPMSVGFLREAFARGLRARVQRSVNASVEGGVALESLFFGSFASVIPRRARGHPSSARRRRSRTTPSSRDASFSRIFRSFFRSFLRSPAGISPLRRRPPRRRRRRHLRLAASAAAASARRRSRRLFVADDARQPPGGPSGASPARVGHEPTALPETPAVAEAPGVPAGACLRRRRPLRGSGFLFPQNLGERNESAGSFGPSRAQTRRRRPGRRRVFMRRNGFATRPHGREEFRVVFPRRLAAAPVRAARPARERGERHRRRARRRRRGRRAPAPRRGVHGSRRVSSLDVPRGGRGVPPGARGSLARLALLRGGDLAERGRRRRPRGRGSRSAGIPGIPGTTAPQLRGGARRRASRAAAAAATAASPPPRATASSSAPERNRESPPRATRDAAASAAARREREDEPAGPSARMREWSVGGSARLRAFATPRAVRASSQLTGYAHGTFTLECTLASSLHSREGSAASSRAFVFAGFCFPVFPAPERRSEGNRRNFSVSFALETSPSVSARNAASASSLATHASASSPADHVSRTRRVSAGTPASASPPRRRRRRRRFGSRTGGSARRAPRRRRSPRTPAARTPSVRRS